MPTFWMATRAQGLLDMELPSSWRQELAFGRILSMEVGLRTFQMHQSAPFLEEVHGKTMVFR